MDALRKLFYLLKGMVLMAFGVEVGDPTAFTTAVEAGQPKEPTEDKPDEEVRPHRTDEGV